MRQDFQPTVYILANRKNGAIYVGVTSNLMQRIGQHREETFNGHSKRVNAKMLVWYEQHQTMETAIIREKRIKNWNRPWKINLIEAQNPDWRDLAFDFGFPPLWSIDKNFHTRHPREGGGPSPDGEILMAGDGFPPTRE